MGRKFTPCVDCGAQNYQLHFNNCQRAISFGWKRQLAGSLLTSPAPEKMQTNNLVNEVVFILDRSGSMAGYWEEAKAALISQVEQTVNESVRTGQETYCSLYVFGDFSRRLAFRLRANMSNLRLLTSYLREVRLSGMTALYDSVGRGIDDLRHQDFASDPNVSFLVITVTDGHENASHDYNQYHLANLIKKQQRTDRWTFVFSVPQGYSNTLARDLDIPIENMQEFELSQRGVIDAGIQTTRGITSFYSGRSVGQTRSLSFYADVAKVDVSDIRSLNDLSQDFVRWVAPRTEQISAAVNSQLGRGTYQSGNAFYALTKSTDLRVNRRIAIMDRDTGAIYCDEQARQLLNIPNTEMVKLRPGDHGNYNVFVQSTSHNRRVNKGDAILYFQPAFASSSL